MERRSARRDAEGCLLRLRVRDILAFIDDQNELRVLGEPGDRLDIGRGWKRLPASETPPGFVGFRQALATVFVQAGISVNDDAVA